GGAEEREGASRPSDRRRGGGRRGAASPRGRGGGGGRARERGRGRLVKAGDVPVAVVVPKGLGASFTDRGFSGDGPSLQLLSDVSDRIAPQMVLGLLQKVTMTAAPDLVMQGGMRQFERYAGALTPGQ